MTWRLLAAALFAASLLEADSASLRAGARESPPASAGSFVYNYWKHGEDWMQGSCSSSRRAQSPIDLPLAAAAGAATGSFAYNFEEVHEAYELVRAGANVGLDFAKSQRGGSIYLDQLWYNLINVNVKVPSEHTWGGIHTPGELHLIHQRQGHGDLLIVALPLDCVGGCDQAPPPAPVAPAAAAAALGVPAPAPSSRDGAASAAATPSEGRPAWDEENANPLVEVLAVAAMLPGNSSARDSPRPDAVGLGINFLFATESFLEYHGSTTAPPCAEAVRWLVRETPVVMSVAQARSLRSAILAATGGSGNNRLLMPLAGRTLAVRSAERRPAVGAEMAAGFEVRVDAPTERESTALRQAQDALAIAKAATSRLHDHLEGERALAAADVARWTT